MGLKANQARLTLQMPTVSGLTYQFDATFNHRGILYVVECKKRRSLLIGSELVHYFSSKILDYVLASGAKGSPLRMRGIFISTQDTGDSGHIFGMAFGIKVIDPAHPPVEYMLSTLPKGEETLRKSLQQLKLRLERDFARDKRISPTDTYKEYQFLRRRWEMIAGTS